MIAVALLSHVWVKVHHTAPTEMKDFVLFFINVFSNSRVLSY